MEAEVEVEVKEPFPITREVEGTAAVETVFRKR